MSTITFKLQEPIRRMTLAAAQTNAPPKAGWRAPSNSRRRSAARPLRTYR